MLPVKEEQAAMSTELEERKQVMFMYHVQHLRKADICRRLNRSRPWLNRWLQRYDPGDVERSLSDSKAGPKQGGSSWSAEIRQQVIDMRKARSQEEKWRYAFIGAQAIHLELKALGSPEVPPVRTIHSWFVQANLVDQRRKQPAKRTSKPIPLPVADAVNRVQQLDLKGPVYRKNSGSKYYLAVLRDGYSHRCAIQLLDEREAQGIVDFLVASWRWMGLPDYLQLDNALEFRGSNRYPRSFGKVVRVALDLGVEPVFNPPKEPWRNGGVERFNGVIADRLLKVKFTDRSAFQAEALAFQNACNHNHRLALQDGLTPDEMAAKVNLRLPPQDYQRHRQHNLPQGRGWVSFVRLVRKSGRITLGAGDRFMVHPDLANQYVLARVDLAQKVVRISHGEQVLQTYDFSKDTVGAWAKEDGQAQDPIADELVSVQATT
jgi:putative transposase